MAVLSSSDFTGSDILTIGSGPTIGLRHVSSEAHAAADATRGVFQGCALNLSFIPGDAHHLEAFKGEFSFVDGFLVDSKEPSSPKAPDKFKGLDQKVREEAPETAGLIDEYTKAIFKFVRFSVGMDLQQHTLKGRMSLKMAVETECRFMLVFTDIYRASDVSYDSYGGLGRLPKSNVAAERVLRITHLDPTLFEEDDFEVEYTDIAHMEAIIDRVAKMHFKKIVETIRSPEFSEKCTEFKSEFAGK
ncbi:MAG: hypothetical protein SP1CHLAM54_14570 [Chlamydiia bacterium]|nr:hypothetical protein [Chlamydiia bacterium]MCH9616348.1 hypothetical protein [Chlamydiia bacterium]MCH9629666.1 hypothetical protein [Chlamydiia bacterium]